VTPASRKQKAIACDGKPAQCLRRRNRSSSAAATSAPSRTIAAAESAWNALIPRMIIRLAVAHALFVLLHLEPPRHHITDIASSANEFPSPCQPSLIDPHPMITAIIRTFAVRYNFWSNIKGVRIHDRQIEELCCATFPQAP